VKYDIKNIVRDNKVFIVGKLKSFTLTEHAELNGKAIPHIRGKVTVSSNIAGQEYTYDLNVFQYKLTQKGDINLGYTQLSAIVSGDVAIGSRVRVSAVFSMSKFKDEAKDQLIESNRLSLKFIGPANQTDTEDKAEFEIGGFVFAGLTDKMNKEGEVYLKELQIMQTNYATSSDKVRPLLLKVHVNKDDHEIAAAIEGAYQRGATIKVSGNLEFITTEYVKEEEVMFGKPKKTTYYNTQKVIRVTSGSEVYTEAGKAYTSDDMKFLMDKYQADSNAIMSGESIKTKPKATSKTASSSTETMFLFPQG